MSRELSINTLIIIGAFFIVFIWSLFWRKHGDFIKKIIIFAFKTIGFIIAICLTILVLFGIGWLFYYFIFGGFFGKSLLSYVLSTISVIVLSVLLYIIFKSEINFNFRCYFLGHNWENICMHEYEYNKCKNCGKTG